MNARKILDAMNVCPEKFEFSINSNGINKAYLKNGKYCITVSPKLYRGYHPVTGEEILSTNKILVLDGLWVIKMKEVREEEIIEKFAEGVILHELFHLYRGDLLKMYDENIGISPKMQKYLYNIAADIVINHLLNNDVISRVGITWEKMKEMYPDIPSVYAGTEEIFKFLLEKYKQEREKLKEKIENVSSSIELERILNENEGGESGKENDEENDEEENGGESGKENDEENDEEENEGESQDVNKIGENERKQLERLRIYARETLRKNRAGVNSGGTKSVPKIKKNELSKELKKAINIVAELIRINNRMRKNHKRVPSSDHRILKVYSTRNYFPDTHIYVDVSGSVGEKVYELLSGNNIIPQDRLWVFSDKVAKVKNLSEVIHGGTLFAPIMENIKKTRAHNVIIISDFYFADASLDGICELLKANKVKYTFINILEV